MIIKTFNTVFGAADQFPLRVKYENNQTKTDWHQHEFVELVLVTDGCGLHVTRYSRTNIQAGDVFAIPKTGEHCYSDTDQLRIMNILFDPENLPMPQLDLYRLPGYNALFMLKEDFFSPRKTYPYFRMTPEQFADLKYLIWDFYRESNAFSEPGHHFCSMGLFMALLGKLSRLYSSNQMVVKTPPFNIGRAISYLNTHFERPVILDELMALSGMSKSTFLRSFIRATGTTPIQYLLNIRVAQACRQLLGSEQSISEISYATGFNDSNYFARIFKKQVGVSPSEFRRRNPALGNGG